MALIPPPYGRRTPNLLDKINKRSPYLRELATTPGERGFASTADMLNNMTFVNDQLDRERFMEEDRLRKANRDPRVIMQKKMVLAGAGFNPKEVEELANDPNYWRPEWERFGLKRPYVNNPIFGGTVTRMQRAKRKIDDKLELDDYFKDRQLQGELRREMQANEALLGQELQFEKDLDKALGPGDYFAGGKKKSSGGSRATSSRKPVPSEGENVLTAANREAILTGGKPIASSPRNNLDPGYAYVGTNISKHLSDARGRRSAAESFYDVANKELESLQLDYFAARKAKTLSPQLDAAYRAAQNKVADAENRITMADSDYDTAARRAEELGLEVNEDTVFDAGRGRVFRYSPGLQGPPMPRTQADLDTATYRSNERRLNPEQLGRLRSETANLDAAGVIDEESDYFNPTGARAQIASNILSGRGYTSRPSTDIGTGATTFAPTLGNRDRYTMRQNLASEIRSEAQRLMQENPDMTLEEATLAAAEVVQSGGRRLISR